MPAEEVQLEKSLGPARKALSSAAGAAAWMEGWAMPVLSAVAYAIEPEA